MPRDGYTMAEVARIVGGKLHGTGEHRIHQLEIDSRRAFPSEGTLFIALHGERHDAHVFLPDLLGRGLRCFVVERLPEGVSVPDGTVFIQVKNSLDALQRLAAWHRGLFRAPVVGITGSNGKTIVKEWLFQVLKGREHIARSPGSWNSQVGVPLSVWGLGADHSMALIEAGISKPGEMERLRTIIRPDIGVFTNLGPAHGENFSDDPAKALEKARLFKDARAVVYCLDHAAVHDALMRSGIGGSAALHPWSREGSAFVHLIHEERATTGTLLRVLHGQREHAFRIPFSDDASVENAMHLITLLLVLGHAPEWIAERVGRLEPVAMRLQLMQGMEGSTLINDAYSNDLSSLRIALDHLVRSGEGRPKVVVLSDIAESAEKPEVLYGRVADMLRSAQVDVLLGVGPMIRAHRDRFHGRVHTYADAGELLVRADPGMIRGAAVLVKGARSFALERVVERWQEKVHGTVLEIDLEAIRHNLNHYRALLRPGTRVMAMVKAFGYGGGALELARLFAHEQVHHLGVAYADEGVELRQQGVRLPILVMNPEPVPHELLQRFSLEPEVYDLRSLRAVMDFAKHHAEPPAIHIKLDTGMRRLGFTAEQLPALLEALREGGRLKVASLFSHLAAAEDPAHDDFSRAQYTDFLAAAEKIIAVLGYRPLLHLANSAATSRFPAFHLDMVRLGIGLHGIGTNDAERRSLLPAASLRSPIAQIKHLPPGASVGYGRQFSSGQERTIATIPLGYADGLPRRLGNGRGQLWIGGKRAPFVGNICMDMSMVDVTDIACREGDPAYLFDAAHGVAELAAQLDTIPYEVLTAISPRVKRVYVQG